MNKTTHDSSDSIGVSFAVTGKGQAGASAGLTAEKNNHLLHEEQEAFTKEMEQANNQEERFEVLEKYLEKYLEKSRENKEKDPSGSEAMEKVFMEELTKLTKFDNAGISFVVNPELGLHENLKAAKAFFGTYNVVKYLPDIFSEGVKLTAIEVVGPATVVGNILNYGDVTYSLYKSYDENGLSKDFAIDSGFEVGRVGFMYKIDQITNEKIATGLVIFGKAKFNVYLNNELKNEIKNELGD